MGNDPESQHSWGFRGVLRNDYLHYEIMRKFELIDLTLDREGALPFRSAALSKVIRLA